MPIIGFHFDKIEAENKHGITKNLTIKPNIDIKSVSKKSTMIGNEEKETIKVSFEYSIEYQELGHIKFEGSITYLTHKEEIDKIIKVWDKEKKLSKLILTPILNLILIKSNIKALNISQDINLPPHIKLPFLVAKESKNKEKNYIG